jgi:hypothetical protein
MRSVPRPVALALVEAVLDAPLRAERPRRHEPVHDPAERAGARPQTSRAGGEERVRHKA